MLLLNSALNISVSMYFFFSVSQKLYSQISRKEPKSILISIYTMPLFYTSGSANYGPPPAFVHNVSLEYTHNHLFTYGLRLLLPYNNKVEWW